MNQKQNLDHGAERGETSQERFANRPRPELRRTF